MAGRGRRNALLLAGLSACVTLQLEIETSRSFLHYAYPWQIARVAAIGILTAIASTLMCAYTARRFQPRRTKLVTGASIGMSALAILLLPSFDAKAWMCLGAAAALCLLCTAAAARGRQDARLGTVVAVLFAAILLRTLTVMGRSLETRSVLETLIRADLFDKPLRVGANLAIEPLLVVHPGSAEIVLR